MATHLITGGSGFVGSHTAERILSKGEDVIVYDLVPPDVPGTDLADAVRYVEGDVRDYDRLESVARDADYLHHNVALVPLTKAGSEFVDVNVEGTRTVMRAALETDIEGVTHVSSSAVYDLSEMPVTEATPVSPIGAYGESKLRADRVALGFAEEGLPVNVIRPRTVLDERRAGIYQILFDWIERGSRVFMLGDGTNEFQLVSGRDVAEASYLAATEDISGEVFNIGNDDYNTLGTDLRNLIEYAGSDSHIVWIPAGPTSKLLQLLDKLRLSPLAPWHYETVHKEYVFDTTKAKTRLGWTPTDSNEEMFERAFDWYQNHDVEDRPEQGSVHRTAPPQKLLRLLRDLV